MVKTVFSLLQISVYRYHESCRFRLGEIFQVDQAALPVIDGHHPHFPVQMTILNGAARLTSSVIQMVSSG